ncbi:97c9ee06-2340-46e8-9cfe-007cd5817b15 [Thermothielavioides terrestris]|uniref:97c9ee06-2340-46e8-9cfe-007cd5817b15 n=1 Tax=Thermothielavioides terrestris TaxID=2587410 RepID=A0A3S4C974_9PEZI|nr:97c9ee06-2340-46e8-9cfe-007cd5817b15 [Thermothielavioides terrestris]
MADQSRLKIISDNPIGNGLDALRTSFQTVCADKEIPCTLDALGQLDFEDVKNLALDLLSALQALRASRLLRSSGSGKDLYGDLLRLNSAVHSDDFNLDRIKPLLKAALADPPNDALIWDLVYDAVTESTPPLRPIASALQQTPWLRNTGSFANSSEYRIYVDNVLKEELGPMYVDLRDFHKTYFGSVPNLETASKTFFEHCLEGSNPLFNNGWTGWPEGAKQDDVLSWFADFTEKLAEFTKSYDSAPERKRRPLAKPNESITGSVAQRKIDVGFVDDPKAGKNSRCHWSQILVPGELKSNPSTDIPSKARLDIGRYAREVFAAQDTRRFVLGFTLCGSLMRIWEFDRLGGVASDQFDINKDGLRFVSTILGFLWMSDEELGFDPTIMTAQGQRFIEIEREGATERLVLDRLMKRTRCIAGRATTCWKAHREGDQDAVFVVKDSWQYPERDEEGCLLREATDQGALHVARYYHHETVRVRDADDDVENNVRKGLDVTKAPNY